MEHAGNFYLTRSQMKDNAVLIMQWLLARGWSKNAICGMLGNMETESSINPGIFENLDYMNMNGGVGLTQWTPATKYINWAQSLGYQNYADWGKLHPQLLRIDHERKNELQWINYEMSFEEFHTSNRSPYDLAMIFLSHYERPEDPNQPVRGQQAEVWYQTLSDVTSNAPHYPVDKDKVFISYPFGWRTNPVTGQHEFHRGFDLAPNDPSEDLPVYSVMDGIIMDRDVNSSLRGNAYSIKQSDGYTSEYLHLDRFASGLNVGSSVQKGQIIGYMGNTGMSSGKHLHYAVSTTYPQDYNGQGSFIDPEIYLQGSIIDPFKPKNKSKLVYMGRPKIY